MSASGNPYEIIPEQPPIIVDHPLIETYGLPAEQIGEGGYGQIYVTDKNFVIKFIRKSKKDDGIDRHDLGEIVYPLSLNHPGIVKCYNAYVSLGEVCLVLPAYEGDLLMLDINKDKAIFNSIFNQCVVSVAYINSRGIIHGDIKPENFLYRKSSAPGVFYEVVLSDFGLAIDRECQNPEKTAYVYSRPYKPPEALMQTDHYGSYSEVWALGCSLYEVWERKHLFFDADFKMNYQVMLKISEKVVDNSGSKFATKWNNTISEILKKPYQPARTSTRFTPDSDVDALLAHMIMIDPEKRILIWDLAGMLETRCDQQILHFDRKLDHRSLTLSAVFQQTASIVFEWMVELTYNIEFNNASATIMALELYCRYFTLESESISVGDVQMLASASMYIAYNKSLSAHVDVGLLVTLGAGSYTRDKFVSFYRSLLQTLNYDLCAKTPADEIMRHLGSIDDPNILYVARDILLLSSAPLLYLDPLSARISLVIALEHFDVLEKYSKFKIPQHRVTPWLAKLRSHYTQRPETIPEGLSIPVLDILGVKMSVKDDDK